MTFDTLGLSAPILDAVARKGYTEPSPIQAQSIPAILTGKDVLAAAQTGTGKTAGFTLPILEKLSHGKPAGSNQVRALILTPTRELAAQVAENVATYGQNLNLRSAVVFGGVKINPQMMKLRKGADILIATPGRLLDLFNQNAVKFDRLEVLVLDEADRMLDMGFIHDIKRILKVLPKKRQNLLFSATFSNEIRELAKRIVKQAVEIAVAPSNATAAKVDQWIYPVDKKRKAPLLLKLIRDNDWTQILVFTRTKRGANRLAQDLDANGILAMAIHGNKSQNQRTKALAEFKDRRINVLVATDIAARGLDIEQLPQVVNFELPSVPEDYVHRIGRTGRAGATGQAISLVCADEFGELVAIQNLIQQLLPRETIEGFEATNELPVAKLGQRPPKTKNKTAGKTKNRTRSEAKPRAGSTKDTKPKGNTRKKSKSDGNKQSQSKAKKKSSNAKSKPWSKADKKQGSEQKETQGASPRRKSKKKPKSGSGTKSKSTDQSNNQSANRPNGKSSQKPRSNKKAAARGRGRAGSGDRSTGSKPTRVKSKT